MAMKLPFRFLPLKFIAPRRPQLKILNPKHEILDKMRFKFEYRNTKQLQNLNSQNPKLSNENFSRVSKCFEISILSFPFLFRISDFEFVVLFILGVLCAFVRVVFYPIPKRKFRGEISKYLWLVLPSSLHEVLRKPPTQDLGGPLCDSNAAKLPIPPLPR
jgi:hypothetical protein